MQPARVHRHYRFWIGLLLALLGGRLPAQDDLENRASLRGLRGIGVQVAVSDAASKAGYTEARLRTEVELRLRESGIRVLNRDEVLMAPGYPDLRVTVDALEDGGTLIYVVTAEVLQAAALTRDRSVVLTEAGTWSTSSFGVVGRSNFAEGMRSSVRVRVERFVNAYLAANSSTGTP